MAYKKYGRDRHKPAGEWVQTTHLTEVSGLSYRKPAVMAFARAAEAAERRGLVYGLNMVREPNNRHDPNAIAIYGCADVKGWFSTKSREWHIGYVPAEVAADVTDSLVKAGVPIGIELYQIFEGADHYFEVKFFILAPPGFGVKKRTSAWGEKP